MRKSKLILSLIALLTLATFVFAAAQRFTFENVTFSDGTIGVIQAGVKITQKSTVIVCDYYSASNNHYLGMYQADFASTNENTVRQFCLDHYADRQESDHQQ